MQVYGERTRAALGNRCSVACDGGAGAVRDADFAARRGLAAAAAVARERGRGVRRARPAARAHRPVAARRRGAGGRRRRANRQRDQLAYRRSRALSATAASRRELLAHILLVYTRRICISKSIEYEYVRAAEQMENRVVEVLIQNAQRLNEASREESDGIHATLGLSMSLSVSVSV